MPLRLRSTAQGLQEDGRHPVFTVAEWAALHLALGVRDVLTEQGAAGAVAAPIPVLALSVAPPPREPLLREALACGAGAALRVWGRSWPDDLLSHMEGTADLTAALAAAASHAIQEWSGGEPLLVLTGDASGDAGHGCFGALLAHGLRAALVQRVAALHFRDASWLAVAKLEQGYSQEIVLPSRAVLTAVPQTIVPRQATLPEWLASRTATITQRLTDLPLPAAPDTRLRIPVPRVKRYAVPGSGLSAEQRIQALVNLPHAGGGTVLSAATGVPDQVETLLSLLREHDVLPRAV
ncbi:MAG TPA: hypothetical protein VL359_01635 [bacterium]|nr:hypothetical protein [bacterium]